MNSAVPSLFGCFALCTNQSHAALLLIIWGKGGRGWEDVCQWPDNHISLIIQRDLSGRKENTFVHRPAQDSPQGDG